MWSYIYLFFKMAMLKLIVDFGTLLIGAEGAKTPAGGRGRGDPAGAQRRGGSQDRPRKAKLPSLQSTGKFNKAYKIKIFKKIILSENFKYGILYTKKRN
jgi:hypothetical protein